MNHKTLNNKASLAKALQRNIQNRKQQQQARQATQKTQDQGEGSPVIDVKRVIDEQEKRYE